MLISIIGHGILIGKEKNRANITRTTFDVHGHNMTGEIKRQKMSLIQNQYMASGD